MIVARLIWPFLVYSFSVNDILPFERLATKYIKKWYGVNKAASPAMLYLPNKEELSGWNITSPVACFKSMQVISHHILKHSNDPLTRSVSSLYRSKARNSKQKKWEPGPALERFEEILSFKSKFGGQTGTQGLGFGRKTNLRNLSLKEKRHLVADLCKEEETETRLNLLRDLARSGDFLKWDSVMGNQHDWTSQILRMSKDELAFALNAQALTLSSPSNLVRWGFNHVARCPLSSKPSATAAHIINGCPVALNQDRYTWRHDNILRTILPDLRGLTKRANRNTCPPPSIPHILSSFNKSSSSSSRPRSQPKKCLLDNANDWSLYIDLDGTFVWPITDVPTIKRPDIVFVSMSSRIIIWAELTSPRESRLAVLARLKTTRYAPLKNVLILKGWRVHDFTFEVGSIGFLARTVDRFLRCVGFRGCQLKALFSRMAQTALRSSFYIWSARFSPLWNPPVLCKASPVEVEILHYK